MKSVVLILAMTLALAGCRNPPRSEAPQVADAWVRLPAVPGHPAAAYFTVRGGASEARLARVSSPQVERIELHGPGMRPLGPQTVPAGGELVFAPGGRHAMLFDIDPSVRVGGRVRLTFSFEAEPPVTVEAEVRGAGDPGDDHG